MANKDLVFDGHAFANEAVAGNFAPASDGCILLHLNKGSDL
jgi:hypothetical protein